MFAIVSVCNTLLTTSKKLAQLQGLVNVNSHQVRTLIPNRYIYCCTAVSIGNRGHGCKNVVLQLIRSAHDQLCRSAAGLLQSLGRDFRFGVLFWIKYWPFWSLVAGNGTEACYLHVCMGTGRPVLPAHSGSP